MGQTVALFDFISHATMHLPFNVGYLKVMLHAFPDDDILFCAEAGHLENIRSELGSEPRISFHQVPRIYSLSDALHNPFKGRKAAEQCYEATLDILAGKHLRLAAMSGVEANLLRTFRKQWSSYTQAPLHYVLHNQLAESFSWRTRHPFYRFFDFRSEFQRGLPIGQHWVALERGIEASILTLVPKLADNIFSLPHPITYEDNEDCTEELLEDRALRIGFLGHCGPGKGFDYFVELAQEFAGDQLEFWAIGREHGGLASLDMQKLTHKPTKGYLAVEDYYAALKQVDIVLLPLNANYSYVASGSVLDAISGLKPIISVETSTYRSLTSEYGSFGPMLKSREAIRDYLRSLSIEQLKVEMPAWKQVLERIRAERNPVFLATDYRKTVVDE